MYKYIHLLVIALVSVYCQPYYGGYQQYNYNSQYNTATRGYQSPTRFLPYNAYGYTGDRALYDPPRQPGIGAGDIRLPVQQRFQWQEANGYCGEQAVQITAMFFGTWASEWTIRDMNIQYIQKKNNRVFSQDDKSSQWTIGVEENDAILDALKLEYALFDADTPAPQFQSFMTWTKNWIQENESPVIMGMYVKGQPDKDYDHIAVAHGILSNTKNDTEYHADDILLYSALQETTGRGGTEAGYYFRDLKNTRQGTNTGNNVFQLPEQYDYGIAVWGFKNMDIAYHTRIEVRNPFPFEVPELAGCQRTQRCFNPGVFSATIVISDLEKGNNYTLLRYDTPSNVPSENGTDYCNSTYDARWDFVANSKEHRINDQFNQVSVIIYRTVDACPDFDVRINNGKHKGNKTTFALNNAYNGVAATGYTRRGTGFSHQQLFSYYFGDNFDVSRYVTSNLVGEVSRRGYRVANANNYGENNTPPQNYGRRGRRRGRAY